MTPARLEPAAPRSRVKHSTTEPLCFHVYCMIFSRKKTVLGQSEMPRPIPRNSVESYHGCTSRIYFDNAGDNGDADVI